MQEAPEMWVRSPGLGKSPGGGNGNHPSILAWKIPWTKEPRGLQSMGSQSQTWLSTHACRPLVYVIFLWLPSWINALHNEKDVFCPVSCCMPDTYESPWHMLSTQDPFAEWMNERRDEAPAGNLSYQEVISARTRGLFWMSVFLNFF